MLDKLQQRVSYYLSDHDTPQAKIYSLFMGFLVLVVCIDFVAGTYLEESPFLWKLELLDDVITIIFLIDYLLRFWVNQFSIRYLFTPLAIIDLIAIMPIFFRDTHWQFIRILRIFRVLRLLRFIRKGKFIGFTVTEFHLRVAQIFFTLFCLVFISSGIMYEVENPVNPFGFGTFFDALYFSVVSLSTVGFGDVVPVTTQGKIIVLLMIFSGGVLIPWQLGRLAGVIFGEKGEKLKPCLGCGKKYHDADAIFCKFCGKELK